jgi:hypothetical protein
MIMMVLTLRSGSDATAAAVAGELLTQTGAELPMVA